MLTIRFVNGESKTGEKGSAYSHWSVSSHNGLFSGVGDDLLNAMTDLAESQANYINVHLMRH